MIPTTNLIDFIKQNDEEVRYMVRYVCLSYNYPGSIDDIVQDVYLKMHVYNVVESYDPHYYDKDTTVEISSLIYPIIKNLIISKLKSPDNRMVRYKLADCDPSAEIQDVIDSIIRNNLVAIEYNNMIHHNESSDSFDGIGSELREFERGFSNSLNNKTYNLKKRKKQDKMDAYDFLDRLIELYGEDNPEIEDILNRIEEIDETGCSLLDIFQLLYKGYMNKEIAAMYQVSNMSITNMKHRLAQEMARYGFAYRS